MASESKSRGQQPVPSARRARYRFPKLLLLRIAWAVARGRQRSLGEDSAGGLRGVQPPPVIREARHLPRSGPFVVVGNHFQRPGAWTGWGAMLVNVAVRRTGEHPRDLHWIMAAELLDYRIGPLRIQRRWIAAVLARFARVYGFGLVTPREAGTGGGSPGLRTAARLLAAGEPVGVLPEGTASPELREARPGVGAALAWLTRGNVPLVPVGIAEVDGVLTATFGPPFTLSAVAGDKGAGDRALSDTAMAQIGRLLPPHLWGHYRDALRTED